MQALHTITLLEGHWLVSRRFSDHRSGQLARFFGRRTVDRTELLEIGRLTVDRGTFSSRRTLSISALTDGSVRFWRPDGSHLFDLDLTCGTWLATHVCGEDRYTICTRLLSADEIHESWKVRGPKKDYDAHTVLRRARTTAPAAPWEPPRR